jgi:uncharacterized protein (TIRG00374 family)
MNAPEPGSRSEVRRQRSIWLRLSLWALAIVLLVWAVRRIEFAALLQALGRLTPLHLLALTAVNVVVLLTLSGRWWVLLSGLGFKLSYLKLSLYRLAAFGLSYFTPGPQFGGEPLQVYLLHAHHEVPITSGTASVTLEKVTELVGNFTFILIGLALIARLEFVDTRAGQGLLLVALLLLALPLVLLLALARGKTPFSSAMNLLPATLRERFARWDRWREGMRAIEAEMTTLFRTKPVHLISAMGFSLLTWILLVTEYWMMLHFLELKLSLDETVAVMTTARLAFLTPLPGGLGVLEAGQAFALQRLGYSLAEGLGVGLLIRGRDVVFGAVGLALASIYAGRGVRGRRYSGQ